MARGKKQRGNRRGKRVLEKEKRKSQQLIGGRGGGERTRSQGKVERMRVDKLGVVLSAQEIEKKEAWGKERGFQ